MVGSDLVRNLSTKFRITGITRKNYDKLKGSAFDVIINANGNSKRFWANEHPFEDFDASTISVYKSMFDFRCGIYIYISSPDVYDKHESPISTSEEISINSRNLSAYGFHKYLSELIVQKYVSNYIILRSSMMLGINLKKGPLYDIFHNIPLYITPDSRLQMITTEEVASVMAFLIQKNVRDEIYNVGGRGTISFRSIDTLVGKKVTFSKNGEKQEYDIDVSKLNRLYPLKTSQEYLRDFLKSL